MVNVINFHIGAVASCTDIDLAGYLEDKIAQLVRYTFVPTTGIAATLAIDANGRMSPVPAGTSVAADHVRLVDWQTVNLGVPHVSVNRIQLTVLYLKDAAGKYP